MTRPILIASIALALGAGCRKKTSEAPPEFSDAIVALLAQFDEDDATVADNIREVERQIYLGMDVEAKKTVDRALAPDYLRDSDVENLDHPNRDISNALPISVAGLSPHPLSQHQLLQVETDHRPWEPYSPDHYVRSFEEGRDCWLDHECNRLVTWNELTKKNVLMEVEYAFHKDFRWIDVGEDDKERWVYIARSWTPESYAGDNEKSFIHQSYTIELWLPRDGKGYIRKPKDQNVDGGEWTSDSNGSGVLRMLTLWSETEFKGLDVGDDAVISTTRAGIDKNFQAGDDYLDTL